MRLLAILAAISLFLATALAQDCQASLNSFSLSIVAATTPSLSAPARLVPTNQTLNYNMGMCNVCSVPLVQRWSLRGKELIAGLYYSSQRTIVNTLVLPNKPLSFRASGGISPTVIYPSYCAMMNKESPTTGLLAANGRTDLFFACQNLTPSLANTGTFDIYYAVNTTDTASSPTRGQCARVVLAVKSP